MTQINLRVHDTWASPNFDHIPKRFLTPQMREKREAYLAEQKAQAKAAAAPAEGASSSEDVQLATSVNTAPDAASTAKAAAATTAKPAAEATKPAPVAPAGTPDIEEFLPLMLIGMIMEMMQKLTQPAQASSNGPDLGTLIGARPLQAFGLNGLAGALAGMGSSATANLGGSTNGLSSLMSGILGTGQTSSFGGLLSGFGAGNATGTSALGGLLGGSGNPLGALLGGLMGGGSASGTSSGSTGILSGTGTLPMQQLFAQAAANISGSRFVGLNGNTLTRDIGAFSANANTAASFGALSSISGILGAANGGLETILGKSLFG